jgi:hypothetical protein
VFIGTFEAHHENYWATSNGVSTLGKYSILILTFLVLVLVLTALLNDVQTARVGAGLKTHARHSPS